MINTGRSIAVVLGAAGKLRQAADAWETAAYLLGFLQLGIEPFYAEIAAETRPDHGDADAVIHNALSRFGLEARWARWCACGVRGSADVTGPISNTLVDQLAGAQAVICLDDDLIIPTELERTIGDRHKLKNRPLLPPVLLDQWRPARTGGARSFAVHADPALARRWGDMPELIELPRQSGQSLELVVAGGHGDFLDVAWSRWREAGWTVRDGSPMARDIDWHRDFVTSRRGLIVLPTGTPHAAHAAAFPSLAAAYLAAGRPVLMPRHPSMPVTANRGLVFYSDPGELPAAVLALSNNYPGHCQAALDVAGQHFNAESVLRVLLSTPSAGRRISPDRPVAAADGARSSPTQKASAATVVRDPVLVTAFPRHTAAGVTPRWLLASSKQVQSDPEDLVLIASCTGDEDTGGGLFAVDADGVREIDRISTLGLHCHQSAAGKPTLVRSIRSADVGVAELLIYDGNGVRNYHRIDGISDVHDVNWDGQNYLAVSTGTNSIAWISPAGEIKRQWCPEAEPKDSWHLNSLLKHNGRWLACAFGRFPNHRGWYGRKGEPDGFLFDIETGRDVLNGLCCPHNPRQDPAGWLICNSATAELLRIDQHDHHVLNRLQMQGWTRGLAVGARHYFVGESAKRHDPGAKTAAVAVVCKDQWKTLTRVSLPCREIYDLTLVPRSLLAGLCTGFSTNPMRTNERNQHALFDAVGIAPLRLWSTGDPLPKDACRADIYAVSPGQAHVKEEFAIECSMGNAGGAIWGPAPPNPVVASYRWLDAATREPLPMTEGQRTMLPRAVAPGETVALQLRVTAPPLPGDYLLRITLVQENVAWFDQIDLKNSRDLFMNVVSDAEKLSGTQSPRTAITAMPSGHVSVVTTGSAANATSR